MVSVPARRGQVVYATGRGLSQRRACTLVQVGRSALQYRSRKAVKNAAVIARMQELSAQYPRFGYRRVRIFLGRDGFAMSPGRAHRLWRALAGRIGCGVWQNSRCRASAHESVLRARDHDHRRRSGRTRYGLSTSCSMLVRTAVSSSA